METIVKSIWIRIRIKSIGLSSAEFFIRLPRRECCGGSGCGGCSVGGDGSSGGSGTDSGCSFRARRAFGNCECNRCLWFLSCGGNHWRGFWKVFSHRFLLLLQLYSIGYDSFLQPVGLPDTRRSCRWLRRGYFPCLQNCPVKSSRSIDQTKTPPKLFAVT